MDDKVIQQQTNNINELISFKLLATKNLNNLESELHYGFYPDNFTSWILLIIQKHHH